MRELPAIPAERDQLPRPQPGDRGRPRPGAAPARALDFSISTADTELVATLPLRHVRHQAHAKSHPLSAHRPFPLCASWRVPSHAVGHEQRPDDARFVGSRPAPAAP